MTDTTAPIQLDSDGYPYASYIADVAAALTAAGVDTGALIRMEPGDLRVLLRPVGIYSNCRALQLRWECDPQTPARGTGWHLLPYLAPAAGPVTPIGVPHHATPVQVAQKVRELLDAQPSPAVLHTRECTHHPDLFRVEDCLAGALESTHLYAATGTHMDYRESMVGDVAGMLAGIPVGRRDEVAALVVDAGRAYVLAVRGPDTLSLEDRRFLRRELQRLAWLAAHEHVAGFAALVRACG